MSFGAAATVAAFLVLVVVSGAQAQVPAQAPPQSPVQTSSQRTALPPDQDFYSLRDPPAAGDAQAQFGLATHYFYGTGVAQDYSQALFSCNKCQEQGLISVTYFLGYIYQHKFCMQRSYTS